MVRLQPVCLTNLAGVLSPGATTTNMDTTTTPQQPRTIQERMDDTAEYLFGQIKCGEPISKQDQKFLTAWLAIKKAQDAIAAGKPIPRCGRAGRRKKVLTGYGK